MALFLLSKKLLNSITTYPFIVVIHRQPFCIMSEAWNRCLFAPHVQRNQCRHDKQNRRVVKNSQHRALQAKYPQRRKGNTRSNQENNTLAHPTDENRRPSPLQQLRRCQFLIVCRQQRKHVP